MDVKKKEEEIVGTQWGRRSPATPPSLMGPHEWQQQALQKVLHTQWTFQNVQRWFL